MPSIPSIFGLIFTISFFVAALKVYQNYKKTGDELVSALCKILLCFTFRSMLTVPSLFTQDLTLIVLFKDLQLFTGFLILAYSLTIHFRFLFSREAPKYLFWGIIFWGFIVFAYRLFYLELAILDIYSLPFYKRLGPGTGILRLSGIFILVILAVIAYNYISGSFRMKERSTKIRATLLGSAVVVFGLRLMAQILKFSLFADPFWNNILLFALTVFAGTLYIVAIMFIKPPERPKYVKKVY